MEAIWKEVKTKIKKHLPDHSYRMWIEPIEFNKYTDDTVILSSPNFFCKRRVQSHYGSLLESEINKASGRVFKVSIEVGEKQDDTDKKLDSKKQKIQKLDEGRQLNLPNLNIKPNTGRMLRKDFTFDGFVVGDNNKFAYSAALSLASRENSNQDALFLLSKTGMGKSHLSQAIGHYILSKYPSERVYYITAEDFTNEMIHGFQHNSIDKFKEKYRTQCDVLLLEDVHFLTGKERTQVELAMALDYLFEADKKIIFSSCYLPSDIPKMSEQLRSRLSSGLISDINAPDFRTRVRILKKKSQQNGYNIPRNVIDYLAGELSDNVRQLESGLIGVSAKSSLLGRPIDLSLAESVAKNIVQQNKTITIDTIKKLVCKFYNISVNEMISKSRKKSIVQPRQIAIYLSRRYTDQPLQAIGRNFNRYHATAMHSIAAVEQKLKEKGDIHKQIDYICQKLDNGNF